MSKVSFDLPADLVESVRENCEMFGMENREQAGGDSGAPVYNGNTAYGLHEGGYTSGGKERDTKSQARYMPTAINVWVATS